jgi:hypothetical protein
MQRPLTHDEIQLLDVGHYEAVTSWNGGPHETLELEASRLHMKRVLARLVRDWGEIVHTAPIYNVGFLAMTRMTWCDLHRRYCDDWANIGDYFGHMARQQWLISYLLSEMDIAVTVAPWSLHAHGHFGLKPGMERRQDGIYADGIKAAFRHYL